MLTARNVNDSTVAEEMLSSFNLKDKYIYKERHLVENLFLKAKNFKRFAMRYDKSAVSFSAVVYIAFILIWLH